MAACDPGWLDSIQHHHEKQQVAQIFECGSLMRIRATTETPTALKQGGEQKVQASRPGAVWFNAFKSPGRSLLASQPRPPSTKIS